MPPCFHIIHSVKYNCCSKSLLEPHLKAYHYKCNFEGFSVTQTLTGWQLYHKSMTGTKNLITDITGLLRQKPTLSCMSSWHTGVHTQGKRSVTSCKPASNFYRTANWKWSTKSGLGLVQKCDKKKLSPHKSLFKQPTERYQINTFLNKTFCKFKYKYL